ncbi:MAG: cytochrome b/b6 domain-containing protein [Actinomycetota bacterium]|nr:cytochrome b/b6 domain-containing protein [Actinomycetota bacterium]
MVETTQQPEGPQPEGPQPESLQPESRRLRTFLRFDKVERTVHWVNAALFGILIVTGAALYLEPVSALIGRRHLVEEIHVYCGLALPVPIVAALAGRWGRGLRADFRRFNRWSDDDRVWIRAVGAGRERRLAVRRHLRLGKFNAGQKLNAVFTGGSILVLLATGTIMRWYHPWPLSFRTGSTFVHDWLSLAVVAAIAGHIAYAMRDPHAMRAMRSGVVGAAWAARHAPAWLAEMEALEGDVGPPSSAPRR